jgi:hypothetical protein
VSDLPRNVILANTQEERTVLTDARTGDTLAIAGDTTAIGVDAAGGRHVRTSHVRVRSDDLRIIERTEQLYACTCGCGLTLLTRHAVLFCGFCQRPVALTHAKTWDDGSTTRPVCPTCFAPGRRQRAFRRFLVWLQQAL